MLLMLLLPTFIHIKIGNIIDAATTTTASAGSTATIARTGFFEVHVAVVIVVIVGANRRRFSPAQSRLLFYGLSYCLAIVAVVVVCAVTVVRGPGFGVSCFQLASLGATKAAIVVTRSVEQPSQRAACVVGVGIAILIATNSTTVIAVAAVVAAANALDKIPCNAYDR